MQALTDRQRMVLDYIRESIRDRGFPPTLREIGRRMGIRSTNGVNDHLRALERKGMLTREDMHSRALRLTHGGLGAAVSPDSSEEDDDDGKAQVPSGFVRIPLFDRIIGLSPMSFSLDKAIGSFCMDRSLLRSKATSDLFALRAHGDAMIDAGILAGDIVIARRQMSATRGEIVIVCIAEEACVRTFLPERDHVKLVAANRMMAPLYIRAGDFKPSMLLGVVVGIYRRILSDPDPE
jgi:repressor LexA